LKIQLRCTCRLP